MFVVTHPVQYAAPLFRRMARDPRLEVFVIYCSLEGAEPHLDHEFGVSFSWDVPLLEEYPWVYVPNRSWHPGLEHATGLFNPGIWEVVRNRKPDAIIILTGYRCPSFWIALAAAKMRGIPVIFGTDASDLGARGGLRWKYPIKRWLWPVLFRLADIVVVPSSRGVRLMKTLGIPSDRIVLTPYVVDNDWWTERSANVNRGAVRRSWGVPDGAPLVLFCAKLQPWKRPQDLLRAFVAANVRDSHLVFAGEGPLRRDLEEETISLDLADRVHFVGFINQTKLPDLYRAADVMVLPSEYEPFGLVVNEAMLCGCPVILSDRVGAGYDLVTPGENGFVYPMGNTDALAGLLREILVDKNRLEALGVTAQQRMESWSPADNINAVVNAVTRAIEPSSSSS